MLPASATGTRAGGELDVLIEPLLPGTAPNCTDEARLSSTAFAFSRECQSFPKGTVNLPSGKIRPTMQMDDFELQPESYITAQAEIVVKSPSTLVSSTTYSSRNIS
jgi:hypothetical protein